MCPGKSYPGACGDSGGGKEWGHKTQTKNKLVVFIMAPGIILCRWLDFGLGSDGRPCRRQLAGVSLVEAVVYCHLAIVPQPLSIVNVMIQTL